MFQHSYFDTKIQQIDKKIIRLRIAGKVPLSYPEKTRADIGRFLLYLPLEHQRGAEASGRTGLRSGSCGKKAEIIPSGPDAGNAAVGIEIDIVRIRRQPGTP